MIGQRPVRRERLSWREKAGRGAPRESGGTKKFYGPAIFPSSGREAKGIKIDASWKCAGLGRKAPRGGTEKYECPTRRNG